MATRTWSGGSSSDLNDPANYGGSGALLTSDDIVFNTGSVNATASADLSVNSITTTSGYSGNWSFSGHILTVAQGAAWDHIGTLNLGNGLIANGSTSTVHIGAGISGLVNGDACNVTMNGTTGMILDDNKGVTFQNLVLGASAKVTNSGAVGSVFQSSATPLTFTSGGTFTVNTTISFKLTATGSPYSITGSPTFNGSAIIIYYLTASAGATMTVPALNYTGGGQQIFQVSSSGVGSLSMTLSGNISTGGSLQFSQGDSNTLIFSSANFGIAAGGNLNLGNSSTGTATYDFGSSTISCNGFPSGIGSGLASLNFNTCAISCNGNWTYNINWTIIPGTSSVTFLGTGASTVTSNGKSFYDVTVNNASKAFSFADTTSLHNLTTSAMASYTHAGTVLTASNNVTYNGSGTVNLGNGITMTGASAILHLGSALGTVTATSCALAMNSTSMTLDLNKAATFLTLTLAASASVTVTGTTTFVLSCATTPLILGASSTLTVNHNTNLNVVGSVDAYSLGAGYTLNGNSILTVVPAATSAVVGLPTLTAGGTVQLKIDPTNNSTVNMSGAISIASDFTVLPENNISLTFSTNNFGITCASFILSESQVGGAAVNNLGSSTINCSSVFMNPLASLSATFTLNMQTCIINCTGNFSYNPSGLGLKTLDAGTSLISFTGTGSSSFTSSGASFYDITVNNASKVFSFADTPSIHNLTVTAMASYTHTGLVLSSSGNVNIDGSGTVNLGNGIIMAGNSATLHIGSTVGTITSSACTVTMSGTGTIIDFDAAVTAKQLILGASATVTWSGSNASSAFVNSVTPLIMGNGSTLTTSQTFTLRNDTNGSPFSFLGTYTWNGAAVVVLYNASGSNTMTIPAVTYTGSGAFSNNSYPGAWILSGDMNLGSSTILYMRHSFNSATTFDTAGYNVTCGSFDTGIVGGTGSYTGYYRSSTFNVTSFNDNAVAGGAVGTHYFGTSQWNCSGAWTFGSINTINHAWDSFNFTNTATITSNGKTFNWVNINASGKTVTLGDNFICRAFKNIAGTLNKNGKQFVITGDYTEVVNSDSLS